jgi:23S rRNA C2498 (ribose-2'-O)-methylase RlmM
MMDWQNAFNLVLAAGVAALGWFGREIWESVKMARKEIRDIDVKMHQDFVRREDFKDAIADLKIDMKEGFSEVRSTLQLLSNKLDGKSDKE